MDPHLRAIEKAKRDRTCSASPQLIGIVTDVCPCWASVYPSIKQESCLSHMEPGSRKGVIKFHGLIISSWTYNETPGTPD